MALHPRLAALGLEEIDECFHKSIRAVVELSDVVHDYDKLFDPAKGRVALVDNDRAFSLSTNIDAESLPNPCKAIGGSLEHGFRSLHREELQSNLGCGGPRRQR